MFSRKRFSKFFIGILCLTLTSKNLLFANQDPEKNTEKLTTIESSVLQINQNCEKEPVLKSIEKKAVVEKKKLKSANPFKSGFKNISTKASSAATAISGKILNKLEKDAKSFVSKAKQPIHLYDLLLKNKSLQNNEELISYGSTFFISAISLIGAFWTRGDKAFVFSEATTTDASPTKLLAQRFKSIGIAISSILIPMGVFGLLKLAYEYSRTKNLVKIREAFLNEKLIYPKNASALLKNLSELYDPQLSAKNWKFFKSSMEKSRFFHSMLTQACEVGFKEEEVLNSIEVVEKVAV